MDSGELLFAQKGAQTQFLESKADITIYGGAAGGGKTYGLLLNPIRSFDKKDINGAIFRREGQQLNIPGSIWTESIKMYNPLGIKPNKSLMQYNFNKNSYLKFAGLQYEQDVYNWQGAQLDYISFDELTHFTEFQFWYLIGRLRSVSGQVKPYCLATCNPDPDSWVYDLVKWWIDPTTYLPILERSGKLRYFFKHDDIIRFFGNEDEAIKEIAKLNLSNLIKPMSLTFIPATLNDNQILLKNDPSYFTKLSQLPETEKMQLLYGAWNKVAQGKLIKPTWFQNFVIEPINEDVTLITVDTASTVKTASDYTVFQCWKRWNGKIYLIAQIRGKFTASMQLSLLANFILTHKAKYCAIELASTGFHLRDEVVKLTSALILEITRKKDKYQRCKDIQAYVQQGYVFINPNADYYHSFVAECASFAPENKTKQTIHDDQVDPFVDACDLLLAQKLDLSDEPVQNINTKMSYITTGEV